MLEAAVNRVFELAGHPVSEVVISKAALAKYKSLPVPDPDLNSAICGFWGEWTKFGHYFYSLVATKYE